MDTEGQLKELLGLTAEKFNQSQIKEYAEKNGFQWMYAVAAARIIPKKPSSFGIQLGCKGDGRIETNGSGVISLLDASLLYESPFTDITPQGPDGLFTSTQVDELITALDRVRAAAVAA